MPRFAERAADNRVRGLGGVDFEALRAAGEAARSRAIADLPALLDSLQEKLEAAGAVVGVDDDVLGRLAGGLHDELAEVGLDDLDPATSRRSFRPISSAAIDLPLTAIRPWRRTTSVT